MKEDFLQFIWANALFKNSVLTSTTGKKIEVVHPGTLNKDSGADFFNAKIKVDDIFLVGNIEIHLKSSDWYRHKHHDDAAYNNVILSVVAEDDGLIYRQDGSLVENSVIDYAKELYDEYVYLWRTNEMPRCKRHLTQVDDFRFKQYLRRLAIERLERKVEDVRSILLQTGNDYATCFYRLLCKYWAGNVNEEPFYQLAMHLPFQVILHHLDSLLSVEALLFGVSGLLLDNQEDEYVQKLKTEYSHLAHKYGLTQMNVSQWKFMRIRPSAFPTVRIALLAAFLVKNGQILSRMLVMKKVSDVMKLMDVAASDYWNTHYSFHVPSKSRSKSIGNGLKRIIILNAFIPYIFMYGREQMKDEYVERSLDWLEGMSPENNYIVQEWGRCGFKAKSALLSQAMIQLHREYCEKHACIHCQIGKMVLRSTVQ